MPLPGSHEYGAAAPALTGNSRGKNKQTRAMNGRFRVLMTGPICFEMVRVYPPVIIGDEKNAVVIFLRRWALASYSPPVPLDTDKCHCLGRQDRCALGIHRQYAHQFTLTKQTPPPAHRRVQSRSITPVRSRTVPSAPSWMSNFVARPTGYKPRQPHGSRIDSFSALVNGQIRYDITDRLPTTISALSVMPGNSRAFFGIFFSPTEPSLMRDI